jgi:hypothetical protein
VAKRKPKLDEFEMALADLARLPQLDERGRIEMLIRWQDRLNNGDAMAFFDHWLDGVCEAIGIDTEAADPMENPFVNGDTTTTIKPSYPPKLMVTNETPNGDKNRG